MQGRCKDMCPTSELLSGINARPHALEQWNAGDRCKHAHRTADMLPANHASNMQARPAGNNRSTSATAASSSIQEYLTPVSAYRRSAAGVSETNEDGLNLIRDLPTLVQSTRHLFECVWMRSLPSCSFAENFAYISDRSRQVKKEITMQSCTQTHPLECIPLLERIVRFHILSGYIQFGADSAIFDRSMNEDRIEDCLQELLACYPLAIRSLTATAASDSSPASSSSTAHSVSPVSSPSVSSLLARQDRFLGYSLLSKLERGSWMMDLRGMISAAAYSNRDDGRIERGALDRCPLSGHLHRAVRLAIAVSTGDYAAFFSLYKHASDPSDQQWFDPFVVAILQVHLLPMQLLCIRRVSCLFAPNSWFAMWELQQLLCAPSVADAATLCKSLCGLTIRRSKDWEGASFEVQQTDSSFLHSQDELARETGNVEWALAIRTKHAVEEAEPVVFQAWYQREWKRRLKRFGVPLEEDVVVSKATTSRSESSAATPTNWEDESATDTTAAPATSNRPHEPLWRWLPNTQIDTAIIARWILDEESHKI